MKKQWKRLAALSSAVIMAAGTLLYFPTDTLQNISWGITASAEDAGAVTWTKTESDNLTWTLYDKQKQTYHYTVTESKIVDPDAVWVLDDFGDDRITIITCTDDGTQRQIVVGLLD